MVWVIRERLVAEGVGVRCTRAAPGRRHMHQPGHSQRYFSVLLYLDVVLFRNWQKTYASSRTLSLVLFFITFLYFCIFIQYFSLPGRRLMHQPGRRLRYFSLNCASFRKKNSTEGRAWNVLFLNTFCTSFFATKTHSPKPGHVDAFPLYQKYPTPSTLVHWDTIGIIHCRAKTMG